MKISDLPQNSETYNSYYKTYKAKYCRKTGLPLICSRDYAINPDLLTKGYSVTRAKKEKIEITEELYGFFRVTNGYVPLFKPKRSDSKK